MSFASYVEESTDIHHIFPQNYCEKMNYDRAQWNSVINKTPLYARTNRIIQGAAPSKYLSSIERNHGVDAIDLDKYLASHQIDVEAIRRDDFATYFENRRQALLTLIETATGKSVAGREEKITNEDISPIDLEEMNEVEE
jgi:hypothetical protein